MKNLFALIDWQHICGHQLLPISFPTFYKGTLSLSKKKKNAIG
jgi:hypothetical protein